MFGIATRYARRTQRLESWLTYVSFALGGEAGSPLLKNLGVVVFRRDAVEPHSLDTAREVRGGAEGPERGRLRLPRKGTRYGTVLVDLERRRLVDILPDRSADTFSRWLEEHPGVEVLSRDRGGEYAQAARRAAPNAVQVADRFHLLKNLKDVVARVFSQHADVLDFPSPASHHQRLTNLRLDRRVSKERTKEQMRNLFESIHALSKKGMKNSQIARALKIHRHTVEKYLAFKALPERRNYTKKLSAIAPYEDYILKRCSEGCRNATQIWKEIAAQGYPGAYQNVVCIKPDISRSRRSAWEDLYRILHRVSRPAMPRGCS